MCDDERISEIEEIDVKMPPIRQYTVKARIVSVKKAEPKISEPELFTEEDFGK